MLKTLPFDMSEFLTTDEDIALFEKEALASGDATHITRCQAIIAKAKQRMTLEHNLSDGSARDVTANRRQNSPVAAVGESLTSYPAPESFK